ncbi:cation:proton antiporter regulatory subunit [Halorientalis brevis]|uniref:Cation:proton antiporter regulatory subunit n=1 Tax=Halorientalis brevis TaxID=1126241 RepID=A0ABD6C614_9EURY|nr:TrkA C-terminal domain-containing protein [Halorientalis brevis]
MTVYEAEVPGVGKKFELDAGDGERLIVIIHHDGKREVYRRPDENADSEKLFTVAGEQARKLGSILEGAYFQPVELDDVQVPLGDAIIEWLDVTADSPLTGQTLRDAEIRQHTGASVIAIQRGDQTRPNPGPEFTIEADDILVTMGTRDELQALTDLLSGDREGPTDDAEGA